MKRIQLSLMNKAQLLSIDSVQLIPVQRVLDDRGVMTVVSESSTPFLIKRIFSISSVNANRGNHAHKECSQFIVCLTGQLKVVVNDGEAEKKYELNASSNGLLIPPGIWAYQEYGSESTMINVYCDQEYKESDYIRSFDDYKDYRNKFF